MKVVIASALVSTVFAVVAADKTSPKLMTVAAVFALIALISTISVMRKESAARKQKALQQQAR